MPRKNIIAAIVLLVFAVCYGVLTANLPARTLPNTPDPAFFPWVNTVLIALLSICLLIQGLMRKNTDTKSEKKSTTELVSTAAKWRAAAALATFIVYVSIMPALGFILATVPFFAAMMILFGERRVGWIVGAAVIVTVLLYILFRHGFAVFLPRGLLVGIIA